MLLAAVLLAQAIQTSPSEAPRPACVRLSVGNAAVIPDDRIVAFSSSVPGATLALSFYDRRGCQVGSTIYTKTQRTAPAPAQAIVYSVHIMSEAAPKIPAGVLPLDDHNNGGKAGSYYGKPKPKATPHQVPQGAALR